MSIAPPPVPPDKRRSVTRPDGRPSVKLQDLRDGMFFCDMAHGLPLYVWKAGKKVGAGGRHYKLIWRRDGRPLGFLGKKGGTITSKGVSWYVPSQAEVDVLLAAVKQTP